MTDIVTTIKKAVCLPDTGCVSVVMCVCDVMQDAADEIERLRQDNHDMRLWLSSLEAAGARMSMAWKRATVIHREMVEKVGSSHEARRNP